MLLFYVDIFLAFRSYITKHNKHRARHVLILTSFVVAVTSGMGLKFTEKGVYSNCILNLSICEKIIILILQGVLAIGQITMMMSLYQNILKTRKATGRQESGTEKGFKIKMCLSSVVIIFSLGLQTLHYLLPVIHDGINMTLLLFYQSITSFCFPVLFVLSTKQFQETLKLNLKSGFARHFHLRSIVRRYT